MKIHRLESFKGGWLVGDFEPSLCRQRIVETAVKHYAPGDRDAAHVHKIATEITVIVSGRARMGDLPLEAGDVLVLGPGEPMPGDFVAIEATATVCIKAPSVPGDKYALGMA